MWYLCGIYVVFMWYYGGIADELTPSIQQLMSLEGVWGLADTFLRCFVCFLFSNQLRHVVAEFDYPVSPLPRICTENEHGEKRLPCY